MLSMLILIASCNDKEQSLSCSVEYDFQLPAPLMEIADAYVEYTDNGKKTTELMKDGMWSKDFSYKWKDDAANANDYAFNTLRIILKPKVSPDKFKSGAQLLKDSKAFMTTIMHYSYVNNDKDYWSGSQTNTSLTGSEGNRYVFTREAQNYSYSINEQIRFFNDQETSPFWDVQFDHVGTKCVVKKIDSNTGQSIE